MSVQNFFLQYACLHNRAIRSETREEYDYYYSLQQEIADIIIAKNDRELKEYLAGR